MNTLPPDDEELHAYVDGRLEANRVRAVESWLQRHPPQAARIAGWKRDAAALRATWAGLEPVPADASLAPSQIRRQLQRQRRARLGLVASCVLALGLGAGLGWQARTVHMAGERLPMADAVAAYRLFADTDLPLESDAGRDSPLQGWLQTNFGAAGAAPDLRSQGFQLQGGRMLSTPEGAAAMLVYQDAAGARIGLYLRPRSDRFSQGERRDGRLLAQYWAEGNTAFALVGPATQTRMRQLRPLLRGAG
ncbi:MAG: anti-sigma factor family protein [Stenotrophomonas sp.]